MVAGLWEHDVQSELDPQVLPRGSLPPGLLLRFLLNHRVLLAQLLVLLERLFKVHEIVLVLGSLVGAGLERTRA